MRTTGLSPARVAHCWPPRTAARPGRRATPDLRITCSPSSRWATARGLAASMAPFFTLPIEAPRGPGRRPEPPWPWRIFSSWTRITAGRWAGPAPSCAPAMAARPGRISRPTPLPGRLRRSISAISRMDGPWASPASSCIRPMAAPPGRHKRARWNPGSLPWQPTIPTGSGSPATISSSSVRTGAPRGAAFRWRTCLSRASSRWAVRCAR